MAATPPSLRVGQYGYSLDVIEDGKRGFAYFDGARYKAKAGSPIRKWAEVIVITTVPEPTIIETWSVFPLSYETATGAFVTVGTSTPLPTTLIPDTYMEQSASLIRWGIPREPAWVDEDEQTAPGAGTALVTQAVTVGKTGRVFGVHIAATEGNTFQLKSGSTVIKTWIIGTAGFIDIIASVPLLDDVAAGISITIVNVTAAAALTTYQASLLYDEA